MSRVDSFDFSGALSAAQHSGAYVARIATEAIVDESSLYDVLQVVLRLPDYFGRNWNALHECLRDLSWIPERDVLLLHDGLPRKLGTEDTATYLDVLEDSVRFWKNREEREHLLIVVFPPNCRLDVAARLAGPPS